VFHTETHNTLLSLPLHASHKLQRLDVGFLYFPKATYSQVDNWLVTNPGKTRRNVAGLFRAVYTITATTEKAKDAFAAIGNYHYRPNVISDEDSEPPEITHKDKKPDENLEVTEDGYTEAASSFRVNGPALPTPASPRTPDNIATTRKYYSHWHGSNKPTAESFSGGQTTQEKISGVRNCV
jgi:hypothetical protein